MANYKITIENIRGDEIRDKPYGDGTESNPYKISSVENLVYMSEHPDIWANKYFRQTNNIDLDNMNWSPINKDRFGIAINYDGNGYSITNLTINNIDGEYVGLFGRLDTGSIISNLIIDNCNIKNYNNINGCNMGAIAGFSYGSGIIENCTVKNSVISSNAGYNSKIGGIIGYKVTGQINNCKSLNNIIEDSLDTYGSSCGGLVGLSSTNIYNCASINNEIFGFYCGGIGGYMSSYASITYTIKNSYSTSNVSSTTYSQGMCGGAFGAIERDGSIIENCYSNGLVVNNGATYVGGFGGKLITGYSTEINNCFWDTETSNQSTSACGIGKTSAQFAQQSTFTDWDFTPETGIWEMGTSYPVLQFEALAIEKETEVFEYPFPYKILKNTTEYDPFSYISYDYMVSTSRTAKFDAFIDDYFDDETFDFINNLTRVGYKKKIDENNGKYDNDITLYNHFYYSTEDDEDEFVRIELDDNTIEHEIGKEIEDKYGELRTVSSREIITEGISTLMCRIYELTTDNERLVYSGLIDKRETKFDGTKLSVSLIDMMGLYVELSEKYNVVVGDPADVGIGIVDLTKNIRDFILFLTNSLNISNIYLPNINEINNNIEYSETTSSTETFTFNIDNDNYIPFKAISEAEQTFDNLGVKYRELMIGHIPIYVEYIETDNKYVFTPIPPGDIESFNFDLNSYFSNSISIMNVNYKDIYYYESDKTYIPGIVNDYENSKFKKKSASFIKDKNPLIINLEVFYYEYATIYQSSETYDSNLYIRPNLGVLYNDTVLFAGYNNMYKQKTSSNPSYYSAKKSNPSLTRFNFLKNALSVESVIDEINKYVSSFEDDFNASSIGTTLFYLVTDSQYSAQNLTLDNIKSIFQDPEDSEYFNLLSIISEPISISDFEINSSYSSIAYSQIIRNSDTYVSVIPQYSDTYSLYDITKLFSLTCYNKILTKNTGELYFDKESYSENNGYIYIDKSDIINNFSQQSMIGDDEEFEILDNVYVGTKYIKEAYKRLETSTKENYKKLYENNNMKVSFNLRNYIYDIKSNLTTTIDQREIEPKDVIRIMHNGYEKIRVFVTSVKFINNNTEIEIEGITLQTRNITVSHLKSDSK